MKRTPLKRRTSLARTSKLRLAVSHAIGAFRVRGAQPKKRTAYARRERATGYMLWVKSQPCCLRSVMLAVFGRDVVHRCEGPIEADHAGDRGLGQKSLDRECIPLCRSAHRDRTDHAGLFKAMSRDEMRRFRHGAIVETEMRAVMAGIELPAC